MLNLKQISSLEKVFLKDNISNFKELNTCSAFKGERISYQIILKSSEYKKYNLKYEVISNLKNIHIYNEGFVPSECPVYEQKFDEHYLTDQTGLFPDVLYPVKMDECINVYEYTNTILWITADIPQDIKPDKYSINIHVFNDNEIDQNAEFTINVVDFALPINDLVYSQWFHTDCIASYYDVPVFSDEHWKLIDSFMKTAVRTGINMIYTPIITPALDTEVGSERPTVQLVDIEFVDGKYLFDFSKFDKWIDMAKSNGFKYFEMAHLFTQWGAEFTPKIVVKENNHLVKKFGWHVRANSEEYKQFLDSFLPALVEELKKLKIDKNTYFHISDEPSIKREHDFDNYVYAKSIVKKYLKDFKIIDALSNVEFYKNGLMDYPICATNKIEPFLNENLKERWCYYCCSQAKDVSNRFMAMPSARTRMLGLQTYMFDIVGFLHWGFNFYYSELSRNKIDPYKTTDAGMAFPSGDAFSVYPGEDGAIESIRSVVFYEGIQDRMMLKLLEEKIGKNETKKFVEKIANEHITFKEYPHNAEFYTTLKNNLIDLLKNS